MATREYLATAKAQAIQRIEAALPESVTSTWPAKGEDRQVAMLDYLAGVLDRSSATKKAQVKMTEAEKEEAEAAAAEAAAAAQAKKDAAKAEKEAQSAAEHEAAE